MSNRTLHHHTRSELASEAARAMTRPVSVLLRILPVARHRTGVGQSIDPPSDRLGRWRDRVTVAATPPSAPCRLSSARLESASEALALIYAVSRLALSIWPVAGCRTGVGRSTDPPSDRLGRCGGPLNRERDGRASASRMAQAGGVFTPVLLE